MQRSEPDFGNNVEDDESGDEYDDEDNSGQVMFEENVEIIMRAAMNLFRKYSSKGIRAIREISPPAISTELVTHRTLIILSSKPFISNLHLW